MNINFSIQNIINSNYQIVFVITGGGSSALSNILNIPGASNIFLEAQIPYNKKTLIEYLNKNVVKSCNAITAVNLADIAFKRAINITNKKKLILGVSCTAALKTLRKRKGKDRAHLAIHSQNCKFYKYIYLNQLTREDQETSLSNSIINYIDECINRL